MLDSSRRCLIQRGNWSPVTGQTWMWAPTASKALTHLLFCAERSSFGSITSSKLSGLGLAQSSQSALLPLSPGFPFEIRISIIFFSANNDSALASLCN